MAYKDPAKQREFQRLWHRSERQRRKKLVVQMFGGGCNKCGYNTNIHALEIDHIKPLLRTSTDNSDSSVVIREIASKKRDISLYQLLCANCHAIKTAEDRKSFGNYIKSS